MVALMLALPAAPTSGDGPLERGETLGGTEALDGLEQWEDTFEDTSHVYVPTGGLVGVEVTGGEVRLKPGSDSGWIASEVISPPSDHRYDVVVLDADVPGDSSVKVSILDPRSEPTEVGFANETVPNYKLMDGTVHDIYPLLVASYPSIRVQVTITASGEDRPVIRGWTVKFIHVDEWLDEFDGFGKMSDHKGLNLTDGTLELNLTSRSSSPGSPDYPKYPPILVAGTPYRISAFTANTAGNGYDNAVGVSAGSAPYDIDVADFNGDGYLDFAFADWSTDSGVVFGDGEGSWTTTGMVTLPSEKALGVATGDFDGDGDPDVALGISDGYTDADSLIYLNDGEGGFSSTADIVLTDQEFNLVKAADLNSDGYDDLVLGRQGKLAIFYGDEDGPSATPATTLTTFYLYDLALEDVDLDGHIDLLLANQQDSGAEVYLGSEDGPDTTADYSLSSSGTYYTYDVASGDINGDGYIDIAYRTWVTTGSYEIVMFEGSATGWSDSKQHSGPQGGWGDSLEVFDINKDGYDDLIYCGLENGYDLFVSYGSSNWPTTKDLTKDDGGSRSVAVAVDDGSTSHRHYSGYFITDEITLPTDKVWDIMALDGALSANNTLEVSILDSSGKPLVGFDSLDQWVVDLSGLSSERKIKVRVVVTSEFNWSTPVLDRLTVKWMDERTWRDEFYGDVRADRMLNLGVSEGALRPALEGSGSHQLLFTSLRGDGGFNTPSRAYFDTGTMNLTSRPPVSFGTQGAAAAALSDVNGDGFVDVAFAIKQTSETNYYGQSPLYLGSPVGWRSSPDHRFPTIGASAVVLEDLNGDGCTDVVFAQEQDGSSYLVDSSLYWGNEEGWNSSADLAFSTRGATGVVAVDLDGNGLKDLAFSCYKAASTSTESLVFLQEATGFCGTVPDHELPTKGARAVASGDVDGDGNVDLVFANAFSAGSAEIDSYVYWGRGAAGFDTTPTGLATKGAESVLIEDLDGNGDLDVVFANYQDNTQNRHVRSVVYMGGGARTFTPEGDFVLETVGATGVAVADLDGTGWKDIVIACQDNGTSFQEASRVFLGGTAGYGSYPDLTAPTVGASDVLVAPLVLEGVGGYLSEPISLDPTKMGSVHTLRYTANLPASVDATVRIVDAETWVPLYEEVVEDGQQELDVSSAFKLKKHPSFRVMVQVAGLESEQASFALDRIWLNWTVRVFQPPEVLELELGADRVYRMDSIPVNVTVSDEFDPAEDLYVTIEHKVVFTHVWDDFLLEDMRFLDGAWRGTISPKVNAHPGRYVFRVNVTDSDDEYSGYRVFDLELEVLNNAPTAPEIRLLPPRAKTTNSLHVEIVRSGTDREQSPIQYLYSWYRDGELVPEMDGNTVPSVNTTRGENWTVEVRAFDGDDESPVATAWKVIENAGPVVDIPLPDPELTEDTADSSQLNLSMSFRDPDGDPLSWSVEPEPVNLTVLVDEATGVVTIVPNENWNGVEDVTFIASDGELQLPQVVTVTVGAVNDLPRFVAVEGQPIQSDPVLLSVLQGDLLVVDFSCVDVEGDELFLSVNSSVIELDEANQQFRFEPGHDEVGTLHFAISVHDEASPFDVVKLNFTIVVENKNDPMDPPRITNPEDGSSVKANRSFSLTAVCYDPDTQYGQELNYTWTSNVSGHLGYGNSLLLNISQPGLHLIMLTVTDGQHERSTYINLTVEPDPGAVDPGDPDPPDQSVGDEGVLPVGVMAGVGVAVLIAAMAGYMVVVKRREDLEDEKLLHELDPEELEPKEALERMAATIKRSADTLEASRREEASVASSEVRDGIEVDTSSVPEAQLSMRASVTEAPSAETARLWQQIDSDEEEETEAEREARRLDNLKRKYQNAIGRLPYGIPAPELREREWTELAAALATGEKRTVDGGVEVTLIEGRWYYSDMEDSGTFLKEHGTKPQTPSKKAAAPATDKEALLSKLEERFILGEISEEAYTELKQKYGG